MKIDSKVPHKGNNPVIGNVFGTRLSVAASQPVDTPGGGSPIVETRQEQIRISGRNFPMVDRVFRLEPVGVRQEPRRAAWGRKTSSVTAASLYEGPPTEPRLSPRPIFLAAAKLVQIWS